MPRLPRLHVAGACYYVTLHGNHAQGIFPRTSDRWLLEQFVAEAVLMTRVRVYAYCWMSTYIRLLIRIAEQPLGAFMQRVSSQYARRVHKRIATSGHLFEKRYEALLVDVDNYFLEVLRTIHLDAVHAHVVAEPENFQWSSHRAYLGTCTHRWVDPAYGLGMFHRDHARARLLYRQFIAAGLATQPDAAHLRGHPLEPRVLGDDRFLEGLALGASHDAPTLTLTEIAARVCGEHRLTLEQLRSPSQSRPLSRARGLIAARALESSAASLSEIARYLNRSASAVARSAQRHGGATLPPWQTASKTHSAE